MTWLIITQLMVKFKILLIFEKAFINQAEGLSVGVFLITSPQLDEKATLILVLKAQKGSSLIISFIICSIPKRSSIMLLRNLNQLLRVLLLFWSLQIHSMYFSSILSIHRQALYNAHHKQSLILCQLHRLAFYSSECQIHALSFQ